MGRWIALVVLAAGVGVAVGWAIHSPGRAEIVPGAAKVGGLLPEGGGTPVATFDGGALTDEELRAYVRDFPDPQGSAESAAKRAIADELAASQAESSGVAKDPIVAAKVKHALAEGWRQQRLDELAKKSAGDEAALREYYEQHKRDYVRPERLVLKVVDIPYPRGSASAKKAVTDKAQALIKATSGKDTATFEEKAKAVGVVTSQKLSQQELQLLLWGEENAKQAWLMVGIGEEKLFETDGLIRVLRLEGREPPLQTSFEDARPNLESLRWYELRAKELEKMDAELAKSQGLKVDDAAVKRAIEK